MLYIIAEIVYNTGYVEKVATIVVEATKEEL